MSHPILYKANETDFSTLGLGVLKDATRCLVLEERNGQFYLEMDYPIDGHLFKELYTDRLLKVNASPLLKNQRFRIIKITKPIKGVSTVYAEHVSNLTQDLPLNPKVNYSGTAQSALNTWSANIADNHPFITFSDIQTVGNGEWTIDKVENSRRALGGVTGSLLDSYGGEYRFDNYHIGLYAQRGNDSGALIAYGKNLVDLEQEEEIASTYTSVYPYTIIRNEDSSETIITLPELFVDSDYVGNYARRKVLVIGFSEEEVSTVEQLRSRAQSYVVQNEIGVPKVSLTVKFVDLAKTLNYKDLKLVEEVNLCDLVTIYYEKLDIRQKAKIIKVVWDALLDQYDELTIGEARASLSRTLDVAIDGKLKPVENRINIIQTAANGKNKVFRGLDEPDSGMSLNDLWYKPVGDGETELYRFDDSMWLLEKVSAGLIQGTLDAENGDVNLINVNVANIVGETSNFVRSAWNGINSNAEMDANRLRFVHNDGSSTEIGVEGLKRVTTSDNRSYHYLFHATTFIYGQSSPTSARWIQLPDDFKGKQFKVFFAIADSMTAPSYSYSIQRFVCTRHPNFEIDYAQARVPVISYKSNTVMDGGAPLIDDVQGLIFAIY